MKNNPGTNFVHCDDHRTNCYVGECSCVCNTCRHEVYPYRENGYNPEQPTFFKEARAKLLEQLRCGTGPNITILNTVLIELIDRVTELEKDKRNLEEEINTLKYGY